MFSQIGPKHFRRKHPLPTDAELAGIVVGDVAVLPDVQVILLGLLHGLDVAVDDLGKPSSALLVIIVLVLFISTSLDVGCHNLPRQASRTVYCAVDSHSSREAIRGEERVDRRIKDACIQQHVQM